MENAKDTFYIYALYALAAQDIFKGKQVPEWISEHPEIAGKKKVKKVFPSIGIKNFAEPVHINAKKFINQDTPFVRDAIRAIDLKITESLADLKHVYDWYKNDLESKVGQLYGRIRSEPDNSDEYVKMIKNLQDHADLLVKYKEPVELLMKLFARSLGYRADLLQIQSNGSVKLISPEEIRGPEGKPIVRKGESIFKSYGKIKELSDRLFDFYAMMGYKTVKMDSIDSIPEIKKFNVSNVPMSKLQIVFSSEGSEGAWDIATMSMRGLRSCQSWTAEGEYKQCLIGSIASKYVGIIYLTSGTDVSGYGSRMIKRCIVRYGINIKTREPVVIVDRMYDSYNHEIAKAFIKALQARTSVPVLNYALNFEMAQGEHHDLKNKTPRITDIQIPEEQMEKVINYRNEDTDEEGMGSTSYMDTQFEYLSKRKNEQRKEKIYDLLRKETNDIIEKTVDYMRDDIVRAGITSYPLTSLIQDVCSEINYEIEIKKIKNIRIAKRLFFMKVFDTQINESILTASARYSSDVSKKNEKQWLDYTNIAEKAWNYIRKLVRDKFENITTEA